MKPHLIIIMADQLRPDFVGQPFTPHINQLMAESTTFSRAYCASPLCVPARGAFFTGTYPNQNGSLINPWAAQDRQHGLVQAGLPNLYRLLESDWDSWHTGKQHLFTVDQFDKAPDSQTNWRSLEQYYPAHLERLGQRPPGGPDFRGFLPELVSSSTTHRRGYSIPTTGRYDGGFEAFFDGFILNTSLQAIKQRDRHKPFALNAMFLAPHPPLEIPEPYYSRIQALDLPENVGRWSQDQSPLQLYNLTGYFGSRYSRQDWAAIWPTYAGLVALLDDCVGQLIATLKAEGLYDEAIILFTADHGEMLGSHTLWQKMCMYEEAVRTPLAIKLPAGSKQIANYDGLISHVDVLPTLCDLLGLDTPATVSGHSFAETLRNGQPVKREAAYIQFDGNGALGNFQRAIVRGHHKLIVDTFKDEVFFELYDVVHDPQEMVNLAFDDPAQVRVLYAELLAHMRQTGDQLSLTLDDYTYFLQAYTPFRAGASAASVPESVRRL
jgi:arylsulfatase A-like enzyme